MTARTLTLPATPVEVFVAAKGVVDGSAEPMITIGFGRDLADSEFFAVSLRDARRLRRLLGEALLAPAPIVDEEGKNDDAPV